MDDMGSDLARELAIWSALADLDRIASTIQNNPRLDSELAKIQEHRPALYSPST